MVDKPRNHGKDWTTAEDNAIRTKAKGGMPTDEIARDLGRTVSAVMAEASKKGISLKPVDQPPARRRRKH